MLCLVYFREPTSSCCLEGISDISPDLFRVRVRVINSARTLQSYPCPNLVLPCSYSPRAYSFRDAHPALPWIHFFIPTALLFLSQILHCTTQAAFTRQALASEPPDLLCKTGPSLLCTPRPSNLEPSPLPTSLLHLVPRLPCFPPTPWLKCATPPLRRKDLALAMRASTHSRINRIHTLNNRQLTLTRATASTAVPNTPSTVYLARPHQFLPLARLPSLVPITPRARVLVPAPVILM